MSLNKRIIISFIILYTIIILSTSFTTLETVRDEVIDDLTLQYRESFRSANADFEVFFNGIQQDLLTLYDNPIVKNREDSKFTQFLNADEKTFKYDYTPEEMAIIQLFNQYRTHHSYVNSVYMGRENGSFVRSHPRSAPTQYDPRLRPWYELALLKPGRIQMTDSYTSLTNNDVNIGTVLAMTDQEGIVYGVIGMDVTLEDLSKRVNAMALNYEGYIEVWDSNNNVIVSKKSERLNQSGVDSSYKIVGGFNGILLERNAKTYRLMATNNIPEGHIVAYVDIQSVDREILKIVGRRILFITMVMLFIFVWTVTMLEIFIFKPLRDMSQSLVLANMNGVPQPMSIVAKGELARFQMHYNQLITVIEREEYELKNIKLLTISSLASLAEKRDYETGLHIIRTQKYVELLANAYKGLYVNQNLTNEKISLISLCAPLHDIGKVAIPDHILLKPGKLTAEEFELMKLHTVYGKEAMDKGRVDIADQLFIETAISIVYYHHERFDGKGYPEQLSGEQIPIEARIMSIADVYDALTTKRVYKDAISHYEALEIIMQGSGTQFDPQVIEAFVNCQVAFKEISQLYRDE